ncbi:Large ribosomal RNA subunit accumulation protein YceD [Halioglobus japonicus]|nr:Large ribosomal RNA subunit accumulation protein YceD [Halioglobus japonicus]
MLDVRQAAVRGVTVSGALKPLDLQRFRPLLAADEGTVAAEFTFSRDDERRYLMQVAVTADVMVTCQRCLEKMPQHLSSESTLAIVWTDEEASHVPKHLEPLIVMEPPSSLWDVVEEELILALPPFSYHETDECRMKTAAYSDPFPEGDAGEKKPNPFNVLAQLKPGNKH